MIKLWVAHELLQLNPKQIFVTGNKIRYGARFFPKDNYAELGKLAIVEYRVPEDRIIPIPFDVVRDHTINAAGFLKRYLEEKRN